MKLSECACANEGTRHELARIGTCASVAPACKGRRTVPPERAYQQAESFWRVQLCIGQQEPKRHKPGELTIKSIPQLTTKWISLINSAGRISKMSGQKWQLTQVFDDLWLATKNDAVYNNAGAIAVAAHPGATSKHLGTELDLIAEYKQNHYVTYGFGVAHIFTGKFLNEGTPGKDYN